MSADQITVEVAAIEQVAPAIREFTLQPLNGELYPFSAGSHVVVEMPGADKTYRNAYSLMSDPWETREYRIAVRLQDNSRGGSRFMHQQVAVGDKLKITPPANLFALDWSAKKHVLIAGGVGITPFLSYIPELLRRDADFELHYLYRSSQTGAYRAELTAELGARVHSYDSDQGERCDIEQLLAHLTLGTHVYICGPESLIDAVKRAAAAQGVTSAVIHYEEFAAPKPGKPFVVAFENSATEVAVGEQESLLEALEGAGIEIPNLCRGGVCGQCVCTVTAGEIEHRDDYLSAEEKAAGGLMMPCVSRAKSERLVLAIQE